MDYVIKVWLEHYNTVRPHLGKDKGNTVLDTDFTPQLVGEVKCRVKLGGVIKEYYRDAA